MNVHILCRVEIAATIEREDQTRRRRAGAVQPETRLIARGTVMACLAVRRESPLSGSSLRTIPAVISITPEAIAVTNRWDLESRTIVPALDPVWKDSPNVL